MNGKSILRRLLCIFCAAFFLAGMPLRAGAAEADPAQTLTEESPELQRTGKPRRQIPVMRPRMGTRQRKNGWSRTLILNRFRPMK